MITDMDAPIDIRTRLPLVEQAVLEEEPAMTAEDILKKCLEHVRDIDQILVLTMDQNGVLGFFGNCEGLAESVLFMELVKAQALFSRVDSNEGDTIA